jgi:hypothetical protein
MLCVLLLCCVSLNYLMLIKIIGIKWISCKDYKYFARKLINRDSFV